MIRQQDGGQSLFTHSALRRLGPGQSPPTAWAGPFLYFVFRWIYGLKWLGYTKSLDLIRDGLLGTEKERLDLRKGNNV